MKPQLQTYQQKRDFKVTSEPKGRPASRSASRALSYVIQRHQARRLHYDFRLEIEGVLVSWAVPKGPSLDPAVKRLAVHVEDHPLEYGSFQGEIPAGQYGAGHVDIWDKGTWMPASDPAQGLASGRLRFELKGGLRGQWMLLRTGNDDKQWLLRKLDDDHAVAGHDAESDGAPVAPTRPTRRTKKSATDAARTTRVRRTDLPDFLSPQLATLIDRPPSGGGWSYEVKYDGYRMLCRIDGTEAKLFSRNGNDWTSRMPHLARDLGQLNLGQGWIDGEVVCFDDQGISRFQSLQRALDGNAGNLVFVAFDLPFWNGTDLRALPLSDRRQRLSELIETLPADSAIMFTQILDVAGNTEGDSAWTEACRLSLEGLICKKLDAPYTEGRSRAWLKLKCRPQQEFVIGGYTQPSGSRSSLGALLVGLRDGKKLRYVGRVGTGFTQATLESLHQKLSKIHRKTSPFSSVTESSQRYRRSNGDIQWVTPKLVAEVNYAGWTNDGLLRHASFKGLREDKPASAVTGEAAADPAPLDTRTNSSQRKRLSGKRNRVLVGEVNVSSPDRLIYTSPDISKLQLVEYYQSVAEYILPHLLKRRVALLRCPQGTNATCFFQKHLHSATPEGITLDDEQVVIESQRGLLELVQFGVVEFHTWGSSLPHPDRPDRITLDLDPDPDISWADVVTAARLVQRLMQDAGLTPYLKTTGGKGLHLVAPIKATHTWDTVKAFAHAMADYLAREAPRQFTAKALKAGRKGLIFVDYLRNGNGATAVAAFSARARKGAPVSLPVAWEELDTQYDLRGATFNIHNALRHRQKQGSDPWQDYTKNRKALRLAFKNELDT
ncbi:MAG TPA: DNA ligase D [Pusillimonas sp.]|uniref:DNA ligase D n=1 Tax=Pusillimonas sp. TaxID=3040095 RepID=UPI002C430AA8|nr:DNA ligase D [Pusillimonas sp.]HUH88840.1 DNA ligase D [Pusillimonas sp.]